jgi:hypothetical protein
MTITINKVRNYVLLGTIISASATAPAQAGSLKNLNSNDDFIKTQNNLASDDSKDILLEIEKCKKAESCISSPEFDLEEVLDNQDAKKSIDNSFLKKARDTIETIQGASLYRVITTEDGVEHLVPETEVTPSENPDVYTSIYFSGTSEREKVPEPSALIGLIAFFLLAPKRQKSKNSEAPVE